MIYKYDLHLHSCLSPCADDESTPSSVAGFAKLAGVDIAALTDHNSAVNCAAFMRAAAEYGIAALPGMELTTAEDIHVLCLFRKLTDAMDFGEFVESRMVVIPLREDIFGAQLIMNENDEITGRAGHLLTVSSGIGFNEAPEILRGFGGIAIPAHIDKGANSAIEVLAGIPAEAGYRVFELYRESRHDEILRQYFGGQPQKFLRNSDAHNLDAVGTAGGEIELDCDPGDLSEALFEYLQQ